MMIYQYVFFDMEENSFEYVEGVDKNDVDKRAWELFSDYLTLSELEDDIIPKTFSEFCYMPCLYIPFKWRGRIEVDYHEIEFEVKIK